MISEEVLVVDDNPINQKIAEMMLNRMGIRSRIASDGAVAIEMIQQQHFPLVLMDAQMPVMDGMAATTWIRENIPEDRQPIILVMTATIIEDARRSWKELKFDGFIEKPVKLDVFKAAVTEALEGAKLALRQCFLISVSNSRFRQAI